MKVGARRMILAGAGVTVVCMIGVALAAFSVAGHATITSPGRLTLAGYTTIFGTVGPDICTMRSRFKRGEGVGFRITAIDGGTGDIESSAKVVIHITHGGNTV